MPVRGYFFTQDKTITKQNSWVRFSSYTNKKYPMTTPCCQKANPHGITNAHAYTFLGTVELKKNGRTVHRLVRIRNPWAQELYKGPWSDKDPRWTPDFKRQAGFVDNNDGMYFMPFNYYMDYFYQLNVAYYQDYNYIIRKNYKMAQKHFVFIFDNPTSQQVYVTVETLSERNFPRHASCQENAFLNMFLYQRTGGSWTKLGNTEFIGKGLHHSTSGLHGTDLPAGKYRFDIYNWNWDSKKQEEYITVSHYAQYKNLVQFKKYK